MALRGKTREQAEEACRAWVERFFDDADPWELFAVFDAAHQTVASERLSVWRTKIRECREMLSEQQREREVVAAAPAEETP